jgi:hypothetical protein
MENFSMAKFLPGPIMGQISGSVAGTTFSHNRFGQYMRERVKPIVVQNANTSLQRTIFKNISGLWKGLTDAQRLSFSAWAQNNPVTDVLGQSQILTGHQAHQWLNINAWRMKSAVIASPPITKAPAPLTTLSIVATAGPGSVTMTFAPSPFADPIFMQCWAAVTNSPGINFVKNALRLIWWKNAADASPADIGPAIEARLGTLSAGMKVHLSVAIGSATTGLISAPLFVSAEVT